MDSKFIGSSIARQSRYELIHTTLVKFLKTCTLSDLSPEQEERAKEYLKEDSSKTVYRSDSDTLQSNLARIGNFIMEMLATFPATSPAHDLLQRLFAEQYAVKDGKAVLRDKKEVKADSLQNPNDPDATYRAKNDQKVQGYVTNITETVEEGKPNIITSVQVETAVFADCHFLRRLWKTVNVSRILPLKTFMQMVPIKVQTIESLRRITMPCSSRLARCKVDADGN